MTTIWGDKIVDHIKNARADVLIVAPFMRSKALSKLLDRIGDVETTVVTRWRPLDLLAGASDLGVYDLTDARGIKLYLRNDLHAKFFAIDQKCLVGSANVTDAALGWRTPANLELLVSVPRDTSDVVEFEAELLTGAILATREMQGQLAKLLSNLGNRPVKNFGEEGAETYTVLPKNWIPEVSNPEDLFAVYKNNTDVSYLAAVKKELSQFALADGLSEEEFRSWIACVIKQAPFICEVLALIKNQHEIGEDRIKELLLESGHDTSQYSPRGVLKVLNRWFNYFFSEQYETSQNTITLRPVTKL